jgi:hypothetical protein
MRRWSCWRRFRRGRRGRAGRGHGARRLEDAAAAGLNLLAQAHVRLLVLALARDASPRALARERRSRRVTARALAGMGTGVAAGRCERTRLRALPVIDFHDVFATTMAPLEIVLRGTLIYWFLYFVFRWILRRDTGSMGLTDFLFVVLLGDAAQNGMIGNASSTTDAIVLLATLVFWNFLVDYLSSRSRTMEKWLLPARIVLVRNGVKNRRTCAASSLATRS